ncbi:hypothetical protein LF845_05795 [Deferribacterales bacterium Es71-Z0220]|uniref:hypothetical protein n=1 Tax=Deferrivibrio essentukiensis TaxID=2880922 RepID=UPI001F61958E|nr:hypothetical protein [Deferrivibrio essentukiensis]MCB4204470.1 hypothetical protein [Deferrivibrio essentukiensis]
MIGSRGFFLIFLTVSLIFHMALLYVLPSFNIDISANIEKIIDVEFVKTPKVKTENIKNKETKPKEMSAYDLASKILNESFDNQKTLPPDVKLPEFDSKEKINLDRKEENIASPAYKPENTNIDVSSELENKTGVSSTEIAAETNESNSDFFKIESSSVRVRKPIFIPSMPDYSLENDTEVKIQFYVDFKGNPLKITFLTATDSYIEKLSTDFVSRLKFEPAGSQGQLDKAVITLFFKVK